MFESDSFFMSVILPMSIILTTVLIVCISLDYKSSCVSARIFNKQNNTTWSCNDFFWAGEQINSSSSTIKIK